MQLQLLKLRIELSVRLRRD